MSRNFAVNSPSPGPPHTVRARDAESRGDKIPPFLHAFPFSHGERRAHGLAHSNGDACLRAPLADKLLSEDARAQWRLDHWCTYPYDFQGAPTTPIGRGRGITSAYFERFLYPSSGHALFHWIQALCWNVLSFRRLGQSQRHMLLPYIPRMYTE